ncbi:biliverdin-producing heme oxygenase [Phenylobacterium sp.]|uniref:biliverdin-producing heme oxygenase n=1 Tax=Phenylobacterium sp. TaxID=1871053 RepID=UPI0028110777|nr:biliverdin-producing heme oxygenase [Phenylobacterium sp.]
MLSEVHQRLRLATRGDHERLERRADLLARVATLEGRRAVVRRFWRLHVDVEAAVGPWLERLDGLDFPARRRTPRLAQDLAALGLAASREPPRPPKARCVGEALGLFYVLEGSTLGGRAIRRALEAGGSDMQGLSFLDPYGERAGERWRSFLAVLDDTLPTADASEAAVRGAMAGFRHAELRICEGEAA